MDASHKLTEKQQALVIAYTSQEGCIGKVKEAAIAAGYSAKTAHEIGRHTIGLPHVKAAIMRANFEQIAGPIATKAVALLEKAIEDDQLPMTVRVDAAKTILDRAGLSAIRAPQAVSDDLFRKDLSEMTPTELSATIALAREKRQQIESRLARLALGQGSGAMIEGQAVEVDAEEAEG
jgi:hypothetical protein